MFGSHTGSSLDFFFAFEAGDACSEGEYRLLPRADYRGGGCEYNADKQVCDATWSLGWYRPIGRAGNLKLQDVEPDFLTCGTKYPIWMDVNYEVDLQREIKNIKFKLSHLINIL